MRRLKNAVRFAFCVSELFFMLMYLYAPGAFAKQKDNYLDVTATPSSQTRVRVSWEAEGAARYRIYRANIKKSGQPGRYQLIATVSGNKSAYTDKKVKKNREYQYQVKGYDRGKIVCSGTVYAYTGVSCAFAENQLSDAPYSTKSITLQVVSERGIRPTGYEIYRRDPGTKKFRRIAVVKKKTRSVTYKDKSVEKGQRYTYRVRAYTGQGSKRIYSRYSDQLTRYATQKTGKYAVSLERTAACAENEAVICITSQSGNGALVLDDYAELTMETADRVMEDTVHVLAYAKNQQPFEMYDKKSGRLPVLRAGETIFLHVRLYAECQFLMPETLETCMIYMNDVTYNDLHSCLDADMMTGSARVYANTEYYH